MIFKVHEILAVGGLSLSRYAYRVSPELPTEVGGVFHIGLIAVVVMFVSNVPSLKLTVRPWKSTIFPGFHTIKIVDFPWRTVSFFREGIFLVGTCWDLNKNVRPTWGTWWWFFQISFIFHSEPNGVSWSQLDGSHIFQMGGSTLLIQLFGINMVFFGGYSRYWFVFDHIDAS